MNVNLQWNIYASTLLIYTVKKKSVLHPSKKNVYWWSLECSVMLINELMHVVNTIIIVSLFFVS